MGGFFIFIFKFLGFPYLILLYSMASCFPNKILKMSEDSVGGFEWLFN